MGLEVLSVFSFLVPLLFVAAVVAVISARSGSRPPMAPGLVFALSLSLLSLVVFVVSVGFALGSAVKLVGSSSESFSGSVFGSRQSASVSSSDSSSAFVDSTGALTRIPARPVASDAGSDDSNRNRSIASAVIAGLFALAALVGYMLAWNRALLMLAVDASGDHDGVGATRPPPVGYAYLVAGLFGVSLLVLVPLTAAGVFRALAPGVNGTSVGSGVRQLVTFGVVAAISGIILVWHLRLASVLQVRVSPLASPPDVLDIE